MASAMAASTWFHGSAWPPGNQGIMPLGSCQDAMASTVWSSWAPVRMPGTSGSGIGRLPSGFEVLTVGRGGAGVAGAGHRLDGVDHEALAEDRVEHLLGDAGDRRLLGDVPDQELVVELHQREVVVGRADGALE